MTKHAPSHLTVVVYRALFSYDGQPATCYGCGNVVGHMFQDCPARQGPIRARTQTRPASYAAVLAVATPMAETHVRNNPEMDDQTEKQRHESESRKVPCAPTSLAGNEDKKKWRTQANVTDLTTEY